MFLYDLIAHTKANLPLFSEKFSDNSAISAISKTGDDVSVEATAHNLSVGDIVMISGVKTSVEITNITTSGGIATATCATNHDLTGGYTLEAEIASPESAYDGRFTIASVPDIKTFTFQVSGSPSDSTGTLTTFQNYGFNGAQEVTDIIDEDNFKYNLSNDSLLAGTGTNMLLMKDIRISGAATTDRALTSYTKEETDKLWGFFVLDPIAISEDRTGDSDAANERQPGEDFKLRIIDNVSFYVFIPTHDEISGRAAMDLAQELAKPIYKVLAGYIPESVFVSEPQTLLMPIGHSLLDYDGAFIIYRYQFQTTEFMLSQGESEYPEEFMANTGDTLPNFRTTGFKLFEAQLKNTYNEIVKDDNFEVQNENST